MQIDSLQLMPPQNWQDFEDLCCDLWKEIWKYPNTQKNGRQGPHPQHGVDIFGRPNEGSEWAGVQCKEIDNLSNNSLTISLLEKEVEKAKSFRPKLSQYIIATTAPRDSRIQQRTREITDNHQKKGLFSVDVWSWDDIKKSLADYPSLIKKYYPILENNLLENKIENLTEKFDDHYENLNSGIESINETLTTTQNFLTETTTEILTSEYQRELKYAKSLVDDNKIEDALNYLEKLKSDIFDKAPPIVKYGILKYTGSANQKLLKNEKAGLDFIEAFQYNLNSEEAFFIKALGYLLLESKTKCKKMC